MKRRFVDYFGWLFAIVAIVIWLGTRPRPVINKVGPPILITVLVGTMLWLGHLSKKYAKEDREAYEKHRYEIKPSPRTHCSSDTEFELDEFGCVKIWNSDQGEAYVRLSLRELDQLHKQVFQNRP